MSEERTWSPGRQEFVHLHVEDVHLHTEGTDEAGEEGPTADHGRRAAEAADGRPAGKLAT